jgi:hypothetical protein
MLNRSEAFKLHWASDLTRTTCEEVEFTGGGQMFLLHSCPACPHGRIRGFEVRKDRFLALNWRRKHAQVIAIRCEDDHPGRVAGARTVDA